MQYIIIIAVQCLHFYLINNYKNIHIILVKVHYRNTSTYYIMDLYIGTIVFT